MPRHNGTIEKDDNRNYYTPGAGSTLEVMSRSDDSLLRISGLVEAIGLLNLPVEGAAQDGDFMSHTISQTFVANKTGMSPRSKVMTVMDKGHGYMQLCVPSHIMSRYQLNDILNGLDWRMEGYSTCYDKDTLVIHEMWRKSPKKMAASPRRESKDLSNS